MQCIGWREWISLPSLGINRLKVKVDTGARTSALHAFDIREVTYQKRNYVVFKVSPFKTEPERILLLVAPLIDKREIKDSHGNVTLRPVIPVSCLIGKKKFRMELTLVDRSDMKFRMLLGRQALAGNFTIDPQKSYLAEVLPTDVDQ